MKEGLRLYVWEGVLTSYTDGIMFALAHSIKEARELILIKEEEHNCVKEELQRKPRIITKPEGFTVWGGS